MCSKKKREQRKVILLLLGRKLNHPIKEGKKRTKKKKKKKNERKKRKKEKTSSQRGNSKAETSFGMQRRGKKEKGRDEISSPLLLMGGKFQLPRHQGVGNTGSSFKTGAGGVAPHFHPRKGGGGNGEKGKSNNTLLLEKKA